MNKEICLPWTPSYLIQSLLNDQNWFYCQRHSAIKVVNSSYHLIKSWQWKLTALLTHYIIKWASSGIITWHNCKKFCLHVNCTEVIIQKHWWKMYRQQWSLQLAGAYKVLILFDCTNRFYKLHLCSLGKQLHWNCFNFYYWVIKAILWKFWGSYQELISVFK